MNLSISTVLTACILISVIALVLLLVFRSDAVLKQIGPNCMIVLLLMVVVRMLFPLEFWYTYDIWVWELLPDFQMALLHPVISSPVKVMIWQLLCFIWIVGALAILLYKAIYYRRILRYISLLPKEMLVVEDAVGQQEMNVAYSKECKSPFLIGLKNPCLVLPESPYEKEQMRYIALHELMHLRGKDIVWEIIIDLLCTIFWWNPVFGKLKKELFRLIEMRNDMRIIEQLSEEERVQYMECLKDVAMQTQGKGVVFGVTFTQEDFKELKRRMNLIANKKTFSRRNQLVAFVVTAVCLFLTTTVVLTPVRMLSEEEAGGVPLTADNTYLIRTGEQYEVYMNGEYIFTTDDLKPFRGVPVYDSVEEAEENE